MDALLNKPVYIFTKSNKSEINSYGKINCCFISSFQIQMKKLFNDFPDLQTLLNLLYPNQSDAYTNFANDFPEKWDILKNYLINQDIKWINRLDDIILQICLPLFTDNKCVSLTFIDLNMINAKEIANRNYRTLQLAFTDNYNKNKKIISIMQYENHFEPINIDFTIMHTHLQSIKEVNITSSFFD